MGLRLLDLFCGAGGAAVGYHRAGFEVVGVDIKPQPHYPFEFHQADAMAYPLDGFDVIHASPPCQHYSACRTMNSCQGKSYPDLIDGTRKRLIETEKPYVIENVEGAPLKNYMILCGSMFKGLRVYRHRLFECNPVCVFPPATCSHRYGLQKHFAGYHTLKGDNFITCVGHNFKAADGRIAMGIDWMTRDELSQAIPPAYTEWIGRQLMEHLL
jgi:DNA (cytosine-5)-methyltransferase 1